MEIARCPQSIYTSVAGPSPEHFGPTARHPAPDCKQAGRDSNASSGESWITVPLPPPFTRVFATTRAFSLGRGIACDCWQANISSWPSGPILTFASRFGRFACEWLRRRRMVTSFHTGYSGSPFAQRVIDRELSRRVELKDQRGRERFRRASH